MVVLGAPRQRIVRDGQWFVRESRPPDCGRILIICQDFDSQYMLAEIQHRLRPGQRPFLNNEGLSYQVFWDDKYSFRTGPWPTFSAAGFLSLDEAVASAQAQAPARIHWAKPQTRVRSPGFVFISSDARDRHYAERIGAFLRSYGIRVVLDRASLNDSAPWRDAIAGSLANGGVFVACFSEHSSDNSDADHGEEIQLAIDELARSRDSSWFIPIRLDGCESPDTRIGIDHVSDSQHYERVALRMVAETESLESAARLSDVQWIDGSSDDKESSALLRRIGGNGIVCGHGPIDIRLHTAASLWDHGGRRDDYLLSGQALLVAHGFLRAAGGNADAAWPEPLINEYVTASLDEIGGPEALASSLSARVFCGGSCGLRQDIDEVAICSDCFRYVCLLCGDFGRSHNGCSGTLIDASLRKPDEAPSIARPRQGQWSVRLGHFYADGDETSAAPNAVRIIGSGFDFWAGIGRGPDGNEYRSAFLNEEAVAYYVIPQDESVNSSPPWIPDSPGFLCEEDAIAYAEAEINARVFWAKDRRRARRRNSVFISYMREDEARVEQIAEALRQNGIRVWLDRFSISPGDFWSRSIGDSIGRSALFLAFFSRHYSARPDSYMQRELRVAFDEIKYRRDARWLVPIRLEARDFSNALPEVRIGADKVRVDVQWTDCFDLDKGVAALTKRIGGISTLLGRGPVEMRLRVVADLWDRGGRSDYLLSGDALVVAQSFMGLCAARNAKVPTDELIRSYLGFCEERFGGRRASISFESRKLLCDECGTQWRLENIGYCTDCFRYVCPHCVPTGDVHARCGGLVV